MSYGPAALPAAHGGMPGSLLVTDAVLAEAIWTLKSAFEQDKRAQSLAVRSLLKEAAFEFEIARPSPRHSACSKQALAGWPQGDPAAQPTGWNRPVSDIDGPQLGDPERPFGHPATAAARTR